MLLAHDRPLTRTYPDSIVYRNATTVHRFTPFHDAHATNRPSHLFFPFILPLSLHFPPSTAPGTR